jgi:hypothetical protein
MELRLQLLRRPQTAHLVLPLTSLLLHRIERRSAKCDNNGSRLLNKQTPF